MADYELNSELNELDTYILNADLPKQDEYTANLIVNLTPSKTSQLINDGDGTSPFVTQIEEQQALDNKLDKKDLINYSLTKYSEYLYSIKYYSEQLDYQNALTYFYENYHEGNGNLDIGACSALRKNNYFARNYDWYYSEAVSFVVKKEGNNERYSSIGMAGGIPRLSKDFVESNQWDDMYNIVPFFLVDGINEHGVTVTINVVPAGDKGRTTGTHPELEGDEICMLQLPSYILDKFSSAQDAVDWILDEAKIYAPYNEVIQEEMHFMIADKNDTFIVEFIDNEAVLVDNGRNYLTNFYLTDVELGENNKVNPETVTHYGQGLERYNIITENFNKSPREILQLLKYTNAYNANDLSKWWMTEFVAPYHDMGYEYPNLTVLNAPQDFVDCGLLAKIIERYEQRTRDGHTTWQTVHGAIYDINKLQFTLLVQEEDIDKLKTFQLFPTINDGKLEIYIDNQNFEGEPDCVFSANSNKDVKLNIQQKTYIFEQAEPSDEWIINHNLNKFPSITVVDSGSNTIGCATQYIDNNNCILQFNSAFTGNAYLN